MEKKVLALTNSTGGLYNFRRELIEKMIKAGYLFFVSTPIDRKVDGLRELGCQIIETPFERRSINPIKDYTLLLKYNKIIRENKPDNVITYTIKPNIYGGIICRLRKIPYESNITGLGTAFEHNGIIKNIVTKLYKMALKNAKVVFFENKENLDIFLSEHIITKEQAVLLPGAGVNLKRYIVTEYPKHDEIVFLFMGRIMREKGVDELLSSMRLLIQDGIRCKLIMLGGFDENYETIIQEAEKEGWLFYYGYQNDVRPYIQECDCFVLPSWHEGMANTNLECAASGRPIITSNISGCKEAVIDSVSGFLCNPRDINSLYIKMKQFCMLNYSERKNMGIQGRQLMEKIFDKEKVVEKTISEINK